MVLTRSPSRFSRLMSPLPWFATQIRSGAQRSSSGCAASVRGLSPTFVSHTFVLSQCSRVTVSLSGFAT